MHESPTTERVSAREFVERELRVDPELGYAEVQVRAQRVGLSVPRFLYGSTRRALGLPPLVGAALTAPPPTQAQLQSEPSHGAGYDGAEAGDGGGGEGPDADHGDGDDANPPEAGPGAGDASDGQPKGSAFELAVEVLRMSPDISFQDLKARAAMEGLQMPPIVYGRAKALLGLVPTRPRKPRAPAVAPRLLRQVDSAAEISRLPTLDGIRSLEQLVVTVRQLEAERQRLLQVLQDVRKAVEDALLDESEAD
ncbi:MAG: hypothetical protein AB7O97_14655 [Planctomycetota bacterium]